MRLSKRNWLSLMLTAALLVLSAAMTGCGGSGGAAGSANARGFLNTVYYSLKEGKIDFGGIYDQYFSTPSKTAFTKEQYMKEQSWLEGAEITGIPSPEEMVMELMTPSKTYSAYSIYKVSGTLTLSRGGAEEKREFTEYITWQKGGFRFLYRGVMTSKTYDMTQIHDANPIHCQYITLYGLFQGVALDVTMSNPSEQSYSLGNDSGGVQISLEFGAQYTGEAKERVVLEPGQEAVVSVEFPTGTKSAARDILITRIFTLDENGSPIETGDGLSYSMSIVSEE